MKKDILIVLGSPNSATGVLSAISKSRLNCCINHYSEGKLVICTGGWGEHFNTSPQPHAAHAKAYLIENGLSETDFLDLALSTNTVDDAVKIIPIIEKIEAVTLTIITSDYHLDRVSLIFKTILKHYDMEFIGADSGLNEKDYELMSNHEIKAILSIKENGLYY